VLAALTASAFLAASFPAVAVIFGSNDPEPKAESKQPPRKEPTLKETMSAVGQIARDLKDIEAIEKRLASIEKHVAGIDASLVPVGNALKPEGLRQIADLVVDTAYERAKNILMLVTAFGALLIVFGAVMLRWSLSGRRAAPLHP
jgi:aspartate oxidase